VHYTRAEHATVSSLGKYSVYQPFHGDLGLRGDMFANVMMLVMLRSSQNFPRLTRAMICLGCQTRNCHGKIISLFAIAHVPNLRATKNLRSGEARGCTVVSGSLQESRAVFLGSEGTAAAS